MPSKEKKIQAPNPQIETMRENLHQIADKHGDLLHPEVVRASEELDRYLVRYFRNQLGRIAQATR